MPTSFIGQSTNNLISLPYFKFVLKLSTLFMWQFYRMVWLLSIVKSTLFIYINWMSFWGYELISTHIAVAVTPRTNLFSMARIRMDDSSHKRNDLVRAQCHLPCCMLLPDIISISRLAHCADEIIITASHLIVICSSDVSSFSWGNTNRKLVYSLVSRKKPERVTLKQRKSKTEVK